MMKMTELSEKLGDWHFLGMKLYEEKKRLLNIPEQTKKIMTKEWRFKVR